MSEELPADSTVSAPAPHPVTRARRVRPRFSERERARRKSQGLFGHLTTLLLQPRLFFYTLPTTRHWLVIAVLALVLVGYNAVHQTAGATGSPADTSEIPFEGDFTDGGGFPGDSGFPGGGIIMDEGGGFDPNDPFNVPLPDSGGETPGLPGGGATAGDTTSQVTIAVTAAAFLVGIWFLQAGLLMIVTLFRGRSPVFGRSLQIAVWSSVPLLLLLLVQQLYHAAGGTGSAPGLSAVLPRWDFYIHQPADVQWLLMSAFSQVTLWSVWSLLLLYFGGRDALGGRWYLCLLVIALWIGIAVVVPVLLGIAPLPPAGMPL